MRITFWFNPRPYSKPKRNQGFIIFVIPKEGAARESSPRKKKSSASTTASVAVDQAKPLQDGVKDMLVKHHLFSWDL